MDYNEKRKNARAFIVLLAALIAMLLNIKYKRDLMESLIIVLIVIVVFYIISNIALWFIDKIINMEDNKIQVEDETETESDGADEEEESSQM